MESAIPAHLQCPRTRDARASADYTPPNPAYVARFGTQVQRVVMAYVGAQYGDAAGAGVARSGIERLREHARGADAPDRHDTAFVIDEAGYGTLIWVGYWRDPAAAARWFATPALDAWWRSDARLRDACGWFREIASPGVERFETLFSVPGKQLGVACLADQVSDEIREHAYWGSMRDRLPVAQTDALRAAPVSPASAAAPSLGARVAVPGADNVALIRSGQDWSATAGEERRMYLEEVEPVLREGMDCLRDHGLSVGCLSNRYLTVVDDNFSPLEQSYGLSWWRSLEHMERWAESHPTHIAIFGTFMRMVQRMNLSIALYLYHEVSVLRARDQQLEYINCHPLTGLLRAGGG